MHLSRTHLLSILLLAACTAPACLAYQTSQAELEAIKVRAANEMDCHLDFVAVETLRDKTDTVRAYGCGHEQFWTCKDDPEGEHSLCDRVAFPKHETRYLRY